MTSTVFKTWKIFQYNGKDLFLQDSRDEFLVLTFSEISHEFREHATEWTGREVKRYNDGKLELVKTPQEIQQEADERHRHLEIRRDIAGIEAMKNSGQLQPYQQERLETLYKELARFEPVDPTTKTLEEIRANDSITRPTYDGPKRREKKIE